MSALRAPLPLPDTPSHRAWSVPLDASSPHQRFIHSTIVTHQGKVVAFALASSGRIYYNILDLDGGNSNKHVNDADAWMLNAAHLDFGRELGGAGADIVPPFRVPLRDANGSVISKGKTEDPWASSTGYYTSTDTPLVVIEDGKHIYVFRASVPKSNTRSDTWKGTASPVIDGHILVDRFILQQTRLTRTVQVRYRRSRRKTPENEHDTLGVQDMDGNKFYEPTLRLDFLPPPPYLSFAVTQTPSSVTDVLRWTFYLQRSASHLQTTSVLAHPSHLFDLTGSTRWTCTSKQHPRVYSLIPGRCQATIIGQMICGESYVPLKVDSMATELAACVTVDSTAQTYLDVSQLFSMPNPTARTLDLWIAPFPQSYGDRVKAEPRPASLPPPSAGTASPQRPSFSWKPSKPLPDTPSRWTVPPGSDAELEKLFTTGGDSAPAPPLSTAPGFTLLACESALDPKLSLDTSGFLVFGTQEGSVKSSVPVTWGKWNHLAMVYDTTNMTLVLNATVCASVPIKSWPAFTTLGKASSPSRGLNANITALRLWGVALSSKAIQREMFGRDDGSRDTIKACFSFDDGLSTLPGIAGPSTCHSVDGTLTLEVKCASGPLDKVAVPYRSQALSPFQCSSAVTMQSVYLDDSVRISGGGISAGIYYEQVEISQADSATKSPSRPLKRAGRVLVCFPALPKGVPDDSLPTLAIIDIPLGSDGEVVPLPGGLKLGQETTAWRTSLAPVPVAHDPVAAFHEADKAFAALVGSVPLDSTFSAFPPASRDALVAARAKLDAAFHALTDPTVGVPMPVPENPPTSLTSTEIYTDSYYRSIYGHHFDTIPCICSNHPRIVESAMGGVHVYVEGWNGSLTGFKWDVTKSTPLHSVPEAFMPEEGTGSQLFAMVGGKQIKQVTMAFVPSSVPGLAETAVDGTVLAKTQYDQEITEKWAALPLDTQHSVAILSGAVSQSPELLGTVLGIWSSGSTFCLDVVEAIKVDLDAGFSIVIRSADSLADIKITDPFVLPVACPIGSKTITLGPEIPKSISLAGLGDTVYFTRYDYTNLASSTASGSFGSMASGSQLVSLALKGNGTLMSGKSLSASCDSTGLPFVDASHHQTALKLSKDAWAEMNSNTIATLPAASSGGTGLTLEAYIKLGKPTFNTASNIVAYRDDSVELHGMAAPQSVHLVLEPLSSMTTDDQPTTVVTGPGRSSLQVDGSVFNQSWGGTGWTFDLWLSTVPFTGPLVSLSYLAWMWGTGSRLDWFQMSYQGGQPVGIQFYVPGGGTINYKYACCPISADLPAMHMAFVYSVVDGLEILSTYVNQELVQRTCISIQRPAAGGDTSAQLMMSHQFSSVATYSPFISFRMWNVALDRKLVEEYARVRMPEGTPGLVLDWRDNFDDHSVHHWTPEAFPLPIHSETWPGGALWSPAGGGRGLVGTVNGRGFALPANLQLNRDVYNHFAISTSAAYALKFSPDAKTSAHVTCGGEYDMSDLTIQFSVTFDRLEDCILLTQASDDVTTRPVQLPWEVRLVNKMVQLWWTDPAGNLYKAEQPQGNSVKSFSAGIGYAYHVSISRQTQTITNNGGPSTQEQKVNVAIWDTDSSKTGALSRSAWSVDKPCPSVSRNSGVAVHLGGAPWTCAGLAGTLTDVRLYNIALANDFMGPDVGGGCVAWWKFAEPTSDAGPGTALQDSISASHMGRVEGNVTWVPAANPYDSRLTVYINGKRIEVDSYPPTSMPQVQGPRQLTIGGLSDPAWSGDITEVRLWRTEREEEEITDNLFSPLADPSTDLIAYYPMSEGSFLQDESYSGWHLSLAGPGASSPEHHQVACNAPLGRDAPLVYDPFSPAEASPMVRRVTGQSGMTEYGDIEMSAFGARGSFKRAYTSINADTGEWTLTTGFRIGALDLDFVSQVQTAPVLQGYIEGAPPIPAENYYDKALREVHPHSAVRLVQSNRQTFTYSSKMSGGWTSQMMLDGSFGDKWEQSAGIPGAESVVASGKFFEHYKANVDIDGSMLSNTTASRIFQVGTEVKAEVSGQWSSVDSFEFNNVGIALVTSTTADLYALRLRLKDSRPLVAYQLKSTNQPPDTNIIPFPINRYYTKQGCLDGRRGMRKDVDFPGDGRDASYFKPVEAYALKASIEKQRQLLQAEFENYQTGTLDALKLSGMSIASGYGDVKSAGDVGDRQSNDQDRLSAARSRVLDAPSRAVRNLANEYVWSAQGGSYALQQEDIDVLRVELGSTLDIKASVGIGADEEVSVLTITESFKLDAMTGIKVSMTSTKESDTESILQMMCDMPPAMDLRERDSRGSLQNLHTGAVDTYRWMTFYLSPEAEATRTFFNLVVDPIWLDSNDPNAAALRSCTNKDNGQAWRVFHRVTYVSRVLETIRPVAQQLSDAKAIATGAVRFDYDSNMQLLRALGPYVSTAKTRGDVVTMMRTGAKTDYPALLETDELTANVVDLLVAYYDL